MQLLGECYQTDYANAIDLITRKSKLFNGLSCIEVAVNSNHLEFVTHNCVQAMLNNIWTGMFRDVNWSRSQILSALVFSTVFIEF